MARTILVIEDQDQNLYLMKYLLEAHGHRVLLARDGSEGIAIARSETVDLILLDIQLPTMDGHEVARTLRSDSTTRAIPIVAVTSYAMPGDREAVMSAGCTDYIEKPIDPASFAKAISRHFASGPKTAIDERDTKGDVE